jgi:hypothetical protein
MSVECSHSCDENSLKKDSDSPFCAAFMMGNYIQNHQSEDFIPNPSYPIKKNSSEEIIEKAANHLPPEQQSRNEMIQLPWDFIPGPYDVICGRGKGALQHPGNRRYRELVKSSLRCYMDATSKLEKTHLVTSLIQSVEGTSPSGVGFIKWSNGFWYKVSESFAREKCGQR